MKTQPATFTSLWRKIFRRSTPVHDRFLSLSLTLFNNTSGWDRTFSQAQYGRAWA